MTRSRSLSATLLTLAAGVLLAPQAASALSCAEIWGLTYWAAPASLLPAATDEVPADTLLWMHLTDLGAEAEEGFEDVVVLETVDGDDLPVTLVGDLYGGFEAWVAWRPDALLQVGVDYRFRVERTPSDSTFQESLSEDELANLDFDPNGWSVTEFRVSAPATDGLIAAPVVESAWLLSDSEPFYGACGGTGPTDRAEFTLTSDAFLHLAVTGDAPEGAFGMSGGFSDTETVRVTGRWQPTAKRTFQVAGMDMSGNFTGWSDPIEVRMPPAGCTSEVDGADLAVSLFLLLGGLGLGPAWSRRREARGSNQGFVLLLAVGLGVAAAPATAAAGQAETTDAIEESVAPAARATVRPELTGWRGELDREFVQTQIGFGIASGITGGVDLAFAIGMPFRAPGSWHGVVGASSVLTPVLTGVLVSSIIRARIRDSKGRESLFREATAVFVASAVGTGVSLGFTVPGMILTSILGDAVFVFPLAAIPISLLVVNVTAGVLMGRTNPKKRVGTLGHPAPRLVAAGPTGFVVRF